MCQIKKGRAEARTDDTHRMKKILPDILSVIFGGVRTAGLSSARKDGRGFDHDLTGMLLTPWDMDWEKER
jgi:hypothetical protein